MNDNITFKAEVSSNIIFKVLLLKGEAGNNIVSITKTGTSGLVDTYTITLTDGTTSTFTVTNGSGIQSIVKTSTNVLIDTYTITYQNGTTSTFNVTNGRGITDVEKTGTSGILDTYTITYNDNTTSTFTIKNGEDYSVPTGGVIAYDGNDTPEGYEDYTGLVGAGHVIENQAGTELTQRPYMQFVDSTPSDDSQNDTTKIEVIKEITEIQLSSAPDGIYRITDLGDGIITAEDVAYSQSQNVKQKIDSITANGMLSHCRMLPYVPWQNLPSQSSVTFTYLKEWLAYMWDNGYVEQDNQLLYLAVVNPNSVGVAIGHFYGEQTPKQYASFIYSGLDGLTLFGYGNTTFYCEKISSTPY